MHDIEEIVCYSIIVLCVIILPVAIAAAYKRWLSRPVACFGSGMIGSLGFWLTLYQSHGPELFEVLLLTYFVGLLIGALLYGATARSFERQL